MTKKNSEGKVWYHNVKIKNLPASICSENPEHKFIRTRKGQRRCHWCIKGVPYPPPVTISYRDQGEDLFDHEDFSLS
jgi:hypothetical protein